MSIDTIEREDAEAVLPAPAMLEVKDLVVRYGHGRKAASAPAAVDGVSFTIRPGETVGLVGESGSGKSTIGKAILGLQKVSGGSISFQGSDITHAGSSQRQELGGELRAVFQDPNSSLNPRKTIGASLAEPLRVRGIQATEARTRAEDMLERVGLPREAVDRYPSQFSGGQRQRISVARALICEPKLVVCDEAVSALDLSTQAQVLNLLADLRDERGLSYLFIAHDISVVQFLAQRVVVLYRGQVMETGPAAAVTENPKHPFTQALVAASPVPRPAEQAERRKLRESLGVRTAAAVAASAGGCPFSQRCPLATDLCTTERPGPAHCRPVRRRLPLRLKYPSDHCKECTVTPESVTIEEEVAPRRLPAPPPFPAFRAPGVPEEVSEHSLVHRELNYAIAVGFRRLSMDVWLPRNTDGGPVPLVVWIHGGAFQLGDRRELPPTFQPDSVFRLLNEAGIACATADYRHALEAPFPAQLHDIKAAVRYLRQHAELLGIDPERIGAWGESAGGHLAALLGLTGGRADLEGGLGVQGQPSSVGAVVDFYGVSSLTQMPRMDAATSFMSGPLLAAVPDGVSLEPGPMLVGNSHDPALLNAASPLGYVTADAPPFLLIHGDSDGLVPLSQSELLADALAQAGAQQELITIEGGDHCFFFAEDQLDRILSTAVSFFSKELAYKKELTTP
jgi:oligopeptide/dipeptide ABC transporter ATP-binding protein